MSQPAIKVENLGKEYLVGHATQTHTTFYDLLADTLKRPFQRSGKDRQNELAQIEHFWALKDVSFEIQPGEVVGVIGRNGAGKSTLLKILSRITAPTRGRISVQGRLASLLEVGTGFHPELSGRENIFLNGAILGMSRKEVARKFDEIVEFAEVEKFIDTPVKRYSSGMYVRLAFGVAAHLEPEILIIDEVLAVGDAKFQKRCLGKMKDVASQGRTVLFVSHNMLAVQRLCDRAIWLSSGQVKADGHVNEVVGNYLREGVDDQRERIWTNQETAPGANGVKIARMAASPLLSSEDDSLTIATGVRLEFEYWNQLPSAALNLSLKIYSSDDTLVMNAVPLEEKNWFGKGFPQGRYRCVCEIPPHLLNSDRYRVELLVVQNQTTVIYQNESALAFEVEDIQNNTAWHGKTPGVIRPKLNWTTVRLT